MNQRQGLHPWRDDRRRTRLVLPILALLLGGSVSLLAYSVFALLDCEAECALSESLETRTQAVRRHAARTRARALAAPEVASVAPDADTVVRSLGGSLGAALDAAGRGSDPIDLRHWARRAEDARVRAACLDRLTTLSGPEARSLLIEVAGDASEVEKVRGAAARLLGRTGPEARAALEGLLAPNEPDGVRAGAAAALVTIGTAESTARFADVVRDGSPRLRHALVAGLRSNPCSASLGLATAMLGDASLDAGDRASLCESIGAGGHRPAAPELVTALTDERTPLEVRLAAAAALGGVGDTGAIRALESLGGSTPAALRFRALASAQQIRRREAD